MTYSLINRLFPLWALMFSAWGYWQPELFTPLKPGIQYLLGIVMFSMGLSLRPVDFTHAFEHKKLIALGLLIQFVSMPTLAFILGHGFGFSVALFTGIILIGTSPGGTASNVICYLSDGDVALSITITALGTLLCTVTTPWISWILLDRMLDVPWQQMLLTIGKTILLPVLLGVVINQSMKTVVTRLVPVAPSISVLSICIIIAIVVAINRQQMDLLHASLLIAIIVHNAGGLLIGYWIPRLLGYNHRLCKTISIEVGMQNSGLATVLAIKYFSAAAALPGVLYSVVHNLSGSILAGYWHNTGRRTTGGSRSYS